MNALHYLGKLLDDDAEDLFYEGLPEEFRPLSYAEVGALEEKSGTALPDEVREFLLTLGTAGIMDADRFERFDPSGSPEDNRLRLWNKASGYCDAVIDGYMAEADEGVVSRATARKRKTRFMARVKAAHEISLRAVTVSVSFDGKYTMIDPETSKVYTFSLEAAGHSDAPNGLYLEGRFRKWAAQCLWENVP